MNYLAHLFLAQDTAYSRIGNFLGDFVKGSREHLLKNYHLEIVAGIENHRLIDSYTDKHREIKNAISILKTRHGLYSSIIVDVLFDHFLSIHWSKFSTVERRLFIDGCYDSLSVKIPHLPATFRRFLPILKNYDILNTYIDLDGIDHALFRIDQRCTRSTSLCEAISDIEAHYDELGNCFLNFFPDVRAYATSLPVKPEAVPDCFQLLMKG